MADGWEEHTETEFSLEFRILRDLAKRFNLDPDDDKLRLFLIHEAEQKAQLNANERQLIKACHVPNNWKKILDKLDELGIDSKEL